MLLVSLVYLLCRHGEIFHEKLRKSAILLRSKVYKAENEIRKVLLVFVLLYSSVKIINIFFIFHFPFRNLGICSQVSSFCRTSTKTFTYGKRQKFHCFAPCIARRTVSRHHSLSRTSVKFQMLGSEKFNTEPERCELETNHHDHSSQKNF